MKYVPLLSLICLFLVFGCKKVQDLEIEDANGEFAFPLISTNFTFKGLLENYDETTRITVEPNGCIRVTYEGDLLTNDSETIFERINEALPPTFPILDNVTEVSFEQFENFDADYIHLKQGEMTYAFLLEENAEYLTLTLPNFSKDGEILEINLDGGLIANFPYSNTDNPINLEDYIIDVPTDTFTMVYEAFNATGDPVNLMPILSNVTINDLEFYYVEGYFGNDEFDAEEGDIFIDIFENFTNGAVWFQDPTITMTIENSFGIPVSSSSNYFRVVTVDYDTLDLRVDEFGPNLQVDFNYPALDEVGEVKTSEFVFNKDNSNIDSILGSGPLKIEYDINALPNPDADPTIKGFIADDSYYNLKVKADLPMYGRANNFTVLDTLELDMSSLDEANEAEFKIVTENTIPMDISLQVYFARSNGTIIDSLYTERGVPIQSPAVDGNGDSIGSEKTESFVTIAAPRLKEIVEKSRKAILDISFSTTDNGSVPVRVKEENGVEVRMGVIVQL